MKLTDVQKQIHADDAHKWDMLLERDQLRFGGGRLRLPRSCQSETEDSVAAAAMARRCYALQSVLPSSLASIKQANATKCKPATVSGSRS